MGWPPNLVYVLMAVAMIFCCIPMAIPQAHLPAFSKQTPTERGAEKKKKKKRIAGTNLPMVQERQNPADS